MAGLGMTDCATLPSEFARARLSATGNAEIAAINRS